jgi:hypothetical protein
VPGLIQAYGDAAKQVLALAEKEEKYIEDTYIVVEYTNGHVKTIGKDAHMMKNPMWKIMENGKEYWLMYCETNTICKLCINSYQKILDYEIKFERYNCTLKERKIYLLIK